MNLSELKKEIDSVIERVKEDGNDPDEISISILIWTGEDKMGEVWSDQNIEVHYDNNGQVTGCVIDGIE